MIPLMRPPFGCSWIKDVTSIVMPAIVGAKMTVKLKEGAQLEGKRVGNYRPIVNVCMLQD